jgi:hypothetical protein
MWAFNPPPLGEGDREAVEGAWGGGGPPCGPRDGSALPPSGARRAPVSPQRGEMA